MGEPDFEISPDQRHRQQQTKLSREKQLSPTLAFVSLCRLLSLVLSQFLHNHLSTCRCNSKFGEWNAARPNLIHPWLIFSAPSIRECEPVESITQRLEDRLGLVRNPSAPINHCPEHVEEQRPHAIFQLPRRSLCPHRQRRHNSGTGKHGGCGQYCNAAQQSAAT